MSFIEKKYGQWTIFEVFITYAIPIFALILELLMEKKFYSTIFLLC